MTLQAIIEELENLAKLELSKQVKSRAQALLKEFLKSEYTEEEFDLTQSLFIKCGFFTAGQFFHEVHANRNGKKPGHAPASPPAAANGVPIANLSNAFHIISQHPELSGKIWYDEFYQKIFTLWNSDVSREWTDTDDLKLTNMLQRTMSLFRISPETVSQAVRLYANENTRNEPREWMNGLVWDGTDRIAKFFEDYFGAAANAYTDSASHNFWVSMAARIYQPGCQMDNMVVLEGAQGIGKSNALRAIAGRWYAEASESVQSKDFFMILPGKMLIEIAELDSFSRAEVTSIKQVISCPVDRYRAPYARATKDYPRMSVFVGSTNEKEYLKDNTGARRFWPVECFEVKYQSIAPVRDQLFAEAVVRFKEGAKWWEMPKEITEEVQESRRQEDSWEEKIAEYLIGKYEVSMLTLGIDCLN